MSSVDGGGFVTGLITKHRVIHEMSRRIHPLVPIDAPHAQRLSQQCPEETIECARESRNIDFLSCARESLQMEQDAADARCRPVMDTRFLARKIGIGQGGFPKSSICAEILQIAGETPREYLAKAASDIRRAARTEFEAAHPLQQLVHEGEQELALGAIVQIEAAGGEAGAVGDLLDRRAFIAFLAE